MKTLIITGPSGSGKSHLANKLLRSFKNSILIKTDSYYRDDLLIRLLSIFKPDIYDRFFSIKKDEIKNDLYSIYNKDKLITFSHYNFKKKQSSKRSTSINYTDKYQYLILEGIFAHRLDFNYQDSINIVCKEKKEICFKRRLVRDQKYRGRNSQEINKKFNKSWHLFYQNINNFINTYKVITLNTNNKISYEKLISHLTL